MRWCASRRRKEESSDCVWKSRLTEPYLWCCQAVRSRRGRRDVVEHHHRTTWRRLPALPRCFERHQATAHLWKIGWRRVQRWVNWGALFVALYSSSHISMCMFPCVKIKWRWWWWWWCIYFKSCNIHAFRTVGLRNRLQQETHQEMR